MFQLIIITIQYSTNLAQRYRPHLSNDFTQNCGDKDLLTSQFSQNVQFRVNVKAIAESGSLDTIYRIFK